MRTLITLLAGVSLSLANVQAQIGWAPDERPKHWGPDQFLFDPWTKVIPVAYLSSADSGLYLLPAEGGGRFGYLEDGIVFNRTDIHTIGYQDGNGLYENNDEVLGYFDFFIPAALSYGR